MKRIGFMLAAAGVHNIGHGWVVPRQDGAKSRCGGPGLCMECQAEAMMLRPTPTNPARDLGER